MIRRIILRVLHIKNHIMDLLCRTQDLLYDKYDLIKVQRETSNIYGLDNRKIKKSVDRNLNSVTSVTQYKDVVSLYFYKEVRVVGTCSHSTLVIYISLNDLWRDERPKGLHMCLNCKGKSIADMVDSCSGIVGMFK